MLDSNIKHKLEALRELPSVPVVLSEVLVAVENMDLSAKSLAHIIEKDQALTARVLRVANSPFYGFSRRISTIDLAIVILGLNTIKEIVLSLVVKRFFTHINRSLFNVDAFWNYSIYCGAASKYLARKLDYRITGEAFIAGLMHDIGILILIQFFTPEFKKIRELQALKKSSMLEAEQEILKSNHAEIGSWLAEKWQLPKHLCDSIRDHHKLYKDLEKDPFLDDNTEYGGLNKPLTVIVAAAEWFSLKTGFKSWAMEKKDSNLYFKDEFIEIFYADTIFNMESSVEKMKIDIFAEYEKAHETHNLML